MNTVNVTVEDLWPGDVVIARRPGGYTGMPHRFVEAKNDEEGFVFITLKSLDGEREYMVTAPYGWGMVVERVV